MEYATDTATVRARGHALLHRMFGAQAKFREGQWEAIEALVVQRRRVLLVQRTGWGKSLVYFLATRLLRDQGAGPTILISPLLSLMRNQIAMANRIGVRAMTINSANREEWDMVEAALRTDQCDILLVSPERLANERFRQSTLPAFSHRVGMLVVDEVHCISDWGHDFRPDYRRIAHILPLLPRGVPVLGTTATANDRVVADVQEQLGSHLTVLRGPLTRATLQLHVLPISDPSRRLAWLAHFLPNVPGSGIIYCLTVEDAENVAAWLKLQGIEVAAYHAECKNEEREQLEEALYRNELKALAATTALGMGYDKPDLSFVIHYQRPQSVVAYYQQVGRAGRAVDHAYGILFNGEEDDEIARYFIETAFPPPQEMQAILRALESASTLSLDEILARVNVSPRLAKSALTLLEVDGAVARDGNRYFRTLNPWQPDWERIQRVTGQRWRELEQMKAYLQHRGCLMEFLARALDDPSAGPCGKCANCQGRELPTDVPTELIQKASAFLENQERFIEPRKMWPAGLLAEGRRAIPTEAQNAPGRVLCDYADARWGQLVRDGKYLHGRFPDELVQAAAALIRQRWRPTPPPKWVTAIPSQRHPHLVPDFAARLAAALGLPFLPVLARTGNPPEQKTMANSLMQARNVQISLCVCASVPCSPVLLVDDIFDSGWTLTIAGYLLRRAGSGIVYPFALARASKRKE